MRRLKASEIECRVAQVTSSGCSLLLYKTARVDRAILDEDKYEADTLRSRYGIIYCEELHDFKISDKCYEEFLKYVSQNVKVVKHGKFGAMMKVSLVNDGPVTFLVEK